MNRKSKMSIFDSVKKWLFKGINVVKGKKEMYVGLGISLTVLGWIMVNNIKNSGPHDRRLRIFTRILGKPKINCGGFGDDVDNGRMNELKNALEEYIENGEDVATQMNIFVDNKEKLNYFVCDKKRYPDFDVNSLVPIYSSTKNVAAILILIAVKNKWLSYNDRIIQYWPEFPTKMQTFITTKDGIEFTDVNEPKYITVADVLRL